MDYKFIIGGVDYISENDLREALGIAEDRDIFEAIAVLKKSNERAHSEMYNARGEKHELQKKVREILGINRDLGYVDFFEALRHARGEMDAATRLRLESSELSHRNRELIRCIVDIRQAAGMADDDQSDLVEYVERLKNEKAGWLNNYFEMLQSRNYARDEYSKLLSDIRQAAGMADDDDDNDLVEYVKALREANEELANHRVAEGWLRKDNSNLAIDVANLKEQLRVLRYDILKVYREIFDCSNGDPEGTDNENLEDILEEYRRVTKFFEEKFAECDNLKRRLHAARAMCDHLRKENSRQCSYREEFLSKLCKELGLTVEKCPNYLPAMEDNILNSVKTLSESFDGANGELEEMTVELNELRKSHDNLSDLYSCAVKHLGEHLKEVKDILGIDSCDKDTVASAIRALKSAYEKLQKDYDELGKAYSSVLRWNNSYADVRRLLGLSADADAETMIAAVKMLRNAKNSWHNRYESEHTRANGEHKRAEKCFGEIAALKTQVASLERSLKASANEQVGIDAFRNEIRKLEAEKSKVIEALGQDIWDDCVN